MRLARLLAMFAVLVAVPGVVHAQLLKQGCDCYVTDDIETTVELPALPMGFFGTLAGVGPSDPIPSSVIELQGFPLGFLESPALDLCPPRLVYETTWFDPHGTPVAPNDLHAIDFSTKRNFGVDTIVCRPLDTTLPGASASTPVPIELVELSLISDVFFEVGYGGGLDTRDYIVFVTETGVVPGGTMSITTTSVLPNSTSGTMNMSTLPVDFQITFKENPGAPFFAGVGDVPDSMLPPASIEFVGLTGNGTDGLWIFDESVIPLPALDPRWGMPILVLALLASAFFLVRKRAA